MILPPLPDDEKKIYTEEEAQAFLESLEDAPPKYRAFCVLAIYSGLRRGELLGLQWKDLDFDNCVLSVRRTSQYTKEKGYYLAPPKTKKSNHELRLPSDLNIYAHTFSTAQAKASEAIANALPLKPGKGQKKQSC